MKRNIGNEPALYPAPTVIVGVRAEKQVRWTLATHVGIIGGNRVVVSLPQGQTAGEGIRSGGRFSANIVTENLLPQTDHAVGAGAGHAEQAATFEWLVGEAGTPIVDASPLSLECEVETNYPTDGYDNFICKVTNTYADERVLDGKGRIDYRVLRPVLYEQPTQCYLRTGDVIGKTGNLRPKA